jgi:cysteinyl-tRNA synthetase
MSEQPFSAKKPREIWITNTLTRQKERFEPLESGVVRFYSCGPTVYSFVHIGNLRGALVSDLLCRYLRKSGYEVRYVRNYTDVDDKIIKRAEEEKMTPEELAKKYTQEVEKDFAVASCLDPDIKPKATEHIPEMIEMIEKLIEDGKAYVADGENAGEVLYSIESFETYGKLSHRDLETLSAGMSRVEGGAKKRNSLDFSLWKPAKPGEPFWESPWGKGRPGWHIECSAMIQKHLGDQIDIHHGGEDLIFPHHENEIAQSEGATGKDPFVKYWVHHGFLRMNKEKMSKSLGNVLQARDFLTQYSGEVARYLMLSVHYRSPIEFNDAYVDQTLHSLQRIYEAKGTAQELLKARVGLSDMQAETAWGEFAADCEKTRRTIDDAFANDFNTPGALAALFDLIRSLNRTLKMPRANATPAGLLGAQLFLSVLDEEIGAVLGIGRLSPEKFAEDLKRIRVSLAQSAGGDRPSHEEIEKLIQERKEARASKNFARSDEIRDELSARGVLIKDSAQGTTWEYR